MQALITAQQMLCAGRQDLHSEQVSRGTCLFLFGRSFLAASSSSSLSSPSSSSKSPSSSSSSSSSPSAWRTQSQILLGPEHCGAPTTTMKLLPLDQESHRCRRKNRDVAGSTLILRIGSVNYQKEVEVCLPDADSLAALESEEELDRGGD